MLAEMKNLPVEIWSQVAGTLGRRSIVEKEFPYGGSSSRWRWKSDLRHMRLVCRLFCDVATPFLFEAISIEIMRGTDCFSGKDTQPAPKMLWLQSSKFTRHVKILEIRIPDRQHLEWIGGFESFLSDIPTILAEIPNLVRSCTALETLELDYTWDTSSHRVVAEIATVLEARRDKPKILILHFEVVKDFGSWREPLSYAVSKPEQGCFIGLVSRVKHLELRCRQRMDDDSDAKGRHSKGLFAFLAVAQDLESLRVDLIHDKMDFDLNILSTGGPRNLRRLSLHALSMHDAVLLGFMHHYAHSLKDMTLERLWLRSGSWRSIFLALCSIRLSQLSCDSLSYTRRFTDDEMYDYYYWTEVDLPSEGCKRSEFIISGTVELEDFYALGHLQRHVNNVRRDENLKEVESAKYKFIDLAPIEELVIKDPLQHWIKQHPFAEPPPYLTQASV